MEDFRNQEWYILLTQKVLDGGMPAMLIFVAFYFYLFREPTRKEFTEVWGNGTNYAATKRKFENSYKMFLE